MEQRVMVVKAAEVDGARYLAGHFYIMDAALAQKFLADGTAITEQEAEAPPAPPAEEEV